MLTAGVGDADIEYEPAEVPKLFELTNSIAGLFAGEMFLQREILLRMAPLVTTRLEKDQSWFGVAEMADVYQTAYNEVFHRRAEQEVLMPYGLTYTEFRDRNRDLAPTLHSEIIQEMRAFSLAYQETWTIIAGIDNTGTHTWVATGNSLACHDATGFASVGIGARHVSSQFMLAKYSWVKPLADTMRLTYFAKKRSEVAPGVGELTDMCLIGPTPGTLRRLEDAQISTLQGLYEASLKDEHKLLKKDQARISGFVLQLKRPAEQQTTGTIVSSSGPGETTATGEVSEN
jgi:hypothetical protein